MKRALSAGLLALLAGVPSLANAQTAQLAHVTANEGTRGGLLGARLAASTDRVLVGAYNEQIDGVVSGAAYLFERDAAGRWTQVLRITSEPPEQGYYFGGGVAIAGDVAVIGVPGDDEVAPQAGEVRFLERSASGEWLEVADFHGQLPGEGLGGPIALDGSRAAVGAPWPDGGGGAVDLFERDATGTWTRVARVEPTAPEAGQGFGSALALEGDRLLVGAYASDAFGFATGLAFVFEREPGGAWVERAVLHASDAAEPGFMVAADVFGFAVALWGDVAFVGAPGADGAVPDSGAVYRFERDASGAWSEVGKVLAPDGQRNDGFGSALSRSGERLLVGAPADNLGPPLGPGHDAGSAHVFALAEASRERYLGRLVASDAARQDHFGVGVALAGDLAVVGAPENDVRDRNAGAAYFFDVEPLSADVDQLSVAAGGEQVLEIDGGEASAGLAYQVLGSLSGTDPGVVLPGGLVLPLQPDRYFRHTRLGGAPLVAGSGVLDGLGRARAALRLPPGAALALVGATVHHAFVVIDPAGPRGVRLVSNARVLHLVP